VAGTEQGARRNQPVAGLEVAEQRGMHGGHAGGHQAAALGLLQRGQAVLQHLRGGVAEAAVLEVLHLVLEGGLRLLGVVVDEARGEEERLRRFAVVGTVEAAADELGGGAVLAGHGTPRKADKTRPAPWDGGPFSALVFRPLAGLRPGFRNLAASWPDKSRGRGIGNPTGARPSTSKAASIT
jgi:hypothetical protein